MAWFKERWHILREAAGVRKYVAGAILSAIVGFIDQIESTAKWILLEWLGISPPAEKAGMIFGFPSWIVGITVFLGLLFWWTLEYAVKLRRELTPKFSLTFDADRGCLVTTPVKYRNPDGTFRDESEMVSIRGLVTVTSKKGVENCRAYVSSVKKKDRETGVFVDTPYIDDLSMPWAISNKEEISIPYGIKKYFGILTTDKNKNDLEWPASVVHSLRHRDLFKDHTIYRLNLVVAGDGVTEELAIDVDWRGVWDGVKAWPVENT